MNMDHPHLYRLAGVVAVLVAYGVFRLTEGAQSQAFVFAIVAIIALVAPEVLDSLPYGPSK